MSRLPNRRALPRVLSSFSLAVLAALAACGGGGGSPGGAPVPDAGFVLSLSTPKTLVRQGATAQVTATITRQAGFTGAVQVALQGLPAGTTAAPVTIAEGATSATITIAAAGTAPHSLPTGATARASAGARSATRPLNVTVGGAPGAVDTSFGSPRFVDVGEGEDLATAMAVQPDGHIVLVGRTTTTAGGSDIALSRLDRDGAPDAGFGHGGKVVTAVGAGRASDEAYAVALQPDGKILVAGSTEIGNGDHDIVLLRYRADGTLDAGFGDGGKRIVSFGPGVDRALALLVQPDGRIVVAGGTDQGSNASGIDFALVRVTADGALDAGFGTGGKQRTAIRPQSAGEMVQALTLQTVGGQPRLVAVGGQGDFVAARYTMGGQLDASFGQGGTIAGLFGATIGAARAVLELPDHRLVLAGGIGNDVALARLAVDGTPDAGFGNGGKQVLPLSADNWDEATALVRQADGKLLVGGWVHEGAGSAGNFAALRLGADGTPDAGFGNAGVVITPVAATLQRDFGRALVLQADDRVPTVRALQAGEATRDGGFQFAVLRYWL